MALLTIAAGGIIGSWAFRAGNAVSASMMLAEQRKKEEIQRKETMRLIKNARRRELYAEKRAAEIAAREAATQGGMLLLANGATDQAVLEAPTKPQRKRRAKSAVPLVRATTFAAPAEQDSISRELIDRVGLGNLREMMFAVVWQLNHHRDDPAPDRYYTAGTLAGSVREAYDQMLALAGIPHDEARQLNLAYDQVGDPLTLAERLEALGRGKFEAQTIEFLLPLPPLARRQILDS